MEREREYKGKMKEGEPKQIGLEVQNWFWKAEI